jgi:hypothetical protein
MRASKPTQLYHGTDVKNIQIFRRRTNFTDDWEMAATFALEKQYHHHSPKAYVYEIMGDVAKPYATRPYGQLYEFDGIYNSELGVIVYYNNIPIRVKKRYEVWMKNQRYYRK